MIVYLAPIPLLLAVALAVPAERQGPALDPVLVSLRSRIERELRDLKPAPAIATPDSSSGKSLVVRYKTREYMVYPRDMAGRLGPDLQKREGPGDDGFLLRVDAQSKGQVNQAVTPQTLHEPYWQTYLNVYPVVGTDKQLFLVLSFQVRTDKTLIQKITKIAEQFGSHHQ